MADDGDVFAARDAQIHLAQHRRGGAAEADGDAGDVEECAVHGGFLLSPPQCRG
jgi:hypothetical protein